MYNPSTLGKWKKNFIKLKILFLALIVKIKPQNWHGPDEQTLPLELLRAWLIYMLAKRFTEILKYNFYNLMVVPASWTVLQHNNLLNLCKTVKLFGYSHSIFVAKINLSPWTYFSTNTLSLKLEILGWPNTVSTAQKLGVEQGSYFISSV